jgi:hypothetical protein
MVKITANIDDKAKKLFNDYCLKKGLAIMETTGAVVEHAFLEFAKRDIRTVREMLNNEDEKKRFTKK